MQSIIIKAIINWLEPHCDVTRIILLMYDSSFYVNHKEIDNGGPICGVYIDHNNIKLYHYYHNNNMRDYQDYIKDYELTNETSFSQFQDDLLNTINNAINYS